MFDREVVLLDGARSHDEGLAPLVATVQRELARGGLPVRTYSPRCLEVTHCRGCFGCWLETPGMCVEDDAGRVIAKAVVRSETTVLVTPITFGGYSSALKRAVDRWLPLILPYFGNYYGETHHRPRYERYPRLVGIGVLPAPDAEAERVFKALVGRNAINFHAPSHAAEVVYATDDPHRLRERVRAALARNDAALAGAEVAALIPAAEAGLASLEADSGRRALLLIGSPKARKPSTSGVLGTSLLGRLEQRGWTTESRILRAHALEAERRPDLLAAVDRADLLVLAFPLYIDALPYLVTNLLEIVAAHRRAQPQPRPLRMVAIVNNGFPEAHHNAPALAICRRFAAETGIAWAGGLAMGAGEALSSGQPLSATPAGGRPPVRHVIRALDLAGAALAEGRGVPAEAVEQMAANPIPLLPAAAWHWIFGKSADGGWVRQAAEHGVTKERMLEQPYALQEV
jgi:NAD(P)H-dependent FMN reductase